MKFDKSLMLFVLVLLGVVIVYALTAEFSVPPFMNSTSDNMSNGSIQCNWENVGSEIAESIWFRNGEVYPSDDDYNTQGIFDLPSTTGDYYGIDMNDSNFFVVRDVAINQIDILDSNYTRIWNISIAGISLGGFGSSGGQLAYNDSDFFILEKTAVDTVYQLDSSGSTVSSFGVTGSNVRGMAFNGSDIFVLTYTTGDKTIKSYDVSTGSWVRTLNITLSGVSEPIDLDVNGSDFYVIDNSDNFIYHLDVDGNNLSGGFDISTLSSAYSMKYDEVNDNFWFVDILTLERYSKNIVYSAVNNRTRSGDLVVGDKWSCSVRLWDDLNGNYTQDWVNSSELTIIEMLNITDYGTIPVSGDMFNQYVQVWLNVSDFEGVEWCNFTVSNSSTVLNDSVNGTFDGVFWNSSVFYVDTLSGGWIWNVTCRDVDGFEMSVGDGWSSSDNVVPSLSLDNPIDGIVYSSSPSLNLFVQDNQVLNDIRYTVDGWLSSVVLSGFVHDGSAQYINQSLGLADGIYTLVVNVSDSSSNINSSNVTFTITTPSSGESAPPSGGGGGGGTPVVVRLWDFFVNVLGKRDSDLVVNGGSTRFFNFKVVNNGLDAQVIGLSCVGVEGREDVCGWVNLSGYVVSVPASKEFVGVVNGVVNVPSGVSVGDVFYFSVVGVDGDGLRDKVDFKLSVQQLGVLGEYIDRLGEDFVFDLRGWFGVDYELIVVDVFWVVVFAFVVSVVFEFVVLTFLNIVIFRREPRWVYVLVTLSVLFWFPFWFFVVKPMVVTV